MRFVCIFLISIKRVHEVGQVVFHVHALVYLETDSLIIRKEEVETMGCGFGLSLRLEYVYTQHLSFSQLKESITEHLLHSPGWYKVLFPIRRWSSSVLSKQERLS